MRWRKLRYFACMHGRLVLAVRSLGFLGLSECRERIGRLHAGMLMVSI